MEITIELREKDYQYCLDYASNKTNTMALNNIIGIIKAISDGTRYENRLKADMVSMLTDIQLEIVEHEESIIGPYNKETKESDFPLHKIERNNGRKECVDLIQQKINALTEGTDDR